MDALTHQLSAAQPEAAAGSTRVAELDAELKGSEREVRALIKARDTMEVDLKAVLGRHAREVRRCCATVSATVAVSLLLQFRLVQVPSLAHDEVLMVPTCRCGMLSFRYLRAWLPCYVPPPVINQQVCPEGSEKLSVQAPR